MDATNDGAAAGRAAECDGVASVRSRRECDHQGTVRDEPMTTPSAYARGSGLRRGRRNARRHGFTLIEAIVIILIIGVLATLIAPRLIKRVGQSKQAVAKSNASSLANAMRLFIADHGMPREGASIEILWDRPGDVDPADWEPYVDSADKLVDPWGNKFVLVIPGKKNYDFDIVSYGADGSPGGTGEDEDVVAP